MFSDDAFLRVTDWLDLCCTSSIVLPPIQRGSVWRPDQVIDLWDSLLRGFPVGGFMIEKVTSNGNTRVRTLGETRSKLLESDAYGLVDGQQRSLAMLIGWPNSAHMDRRIWVDFADTPGREHLFRLRMTTENHPFGFQREKPSARLPVYDRRRASIIYRSRYGLKESAGEFADFRKSHPFYAGLSLPVDIRDLIEWHREGVGVKAWTERVNQWLQDSEEFRLRRKGESGEQELEAVPVERREIAELCASENVRARIDQFWHALARVWQLKLPAIRIDVLGIEEEGAISDGDPALAVLFKRVGSNGTRLSDADYVFSVIKSHCQETHDLVEEMRSPTGAEKRVYNLASLLSPTDIVGTAVRLAATRCVNEHNRPFPDYDAITKDEFSRLLRNAVVLGKRQGAFLEDVFLPFIKGQQSISLDGLFRKLASILGYRGQGDTGLPPHALWLLSRPLIQVLVYWLYEGRDDEEVQGHMRLDVIRFVLFWALCVTNASKASLLAFKIIRDGAAGRGGTAVFASIAEALVSNNYAVKLFSPGVLEGRIASVIWSEGRDTLMPVRGWARFEVTGDDSLDRKEAIDMYRRWWNIGPLGQFHHPILLWLQRAYVVGMPGSPVAGREEETPYDYDHIMPKAHWGDWTGVGGTARLLDFMAERDRACHILGNSIGNVRAWAAQDNRRDGQDSPKTKLGKGNLEENLVKSVIEKRDYELWETCSADGDKSREWNIKRALAFQSAVERRAFALYKTFFTELRFDSW
ncbi:DUF262 domain-containing protein [Acidiferrobacter sp.]